MRTRTSALAGKFGTAIPISKIEAQNTDNLNVICQIQIVPTPEAVSKVTSDAIPQQEAREVISLSYSLECVEIQMEPATPEYARASSQQKDNVLEGPKQPCHQNDSPTPAAQQQRAISSRYVIDRPPQATTPDATFLESFDSAMKILKEISPRNNKLAIIIEKRCGQSIIIDGRCGYSAKNTNRRQKRKLV